MYSDKCIYTCYSDKFLNVPLKYVLRIQTYI